MEGFGRRKKKREVIDHIIISKIIKEITTKIKARPGGTIL